MEKKILFNATPTEKRAALLENEKVVELVVERPDYFRLVGNIYRGKVTSILPGIQAAFVDIGLEKCAFLHATDVDPSVLLDADDSLMERYTGQGASNKRKRIAKIPIEKVLTVGQEILVQVLKEPISTKGAKLSTQISLAGRFLVLVPDTDFIGVSKKSSDVKRRSRLKKIIADIKPSGVGFIVRTIGLKVSEQEFINEIHQLLDFWRKAQAAALEGSGPKLVHRELGITTRVIRDLFSEDVTKVYADQEEDFKEILGYLRALSPALCNRVVHYKDKVPLFDQFDIEKDLERLLKRKVWLRSGGYVLIDRTEALVAIDVNTGRNIGKSSLEETIFKTNLDAAAEICRQLRLRDIGGLIVVDFIDMRQADHRRTIERTMQKLLAADPSANACTGLSKFGLMEITRKRVRPELQEYFTDVCPACEGLGWVFSAESVTARIDRDLRRRTDKKGDLELLVPSSVSAYLTMEGSQILKMLEREHGRKLTIVEDDELDQDEYTIRQMSGSNRKKRVTESDQ
ncbi:MAG: Rne/Rng family ribonuclease [Chitinispirillaceae bacterium]|nr:Rne/Rng family ribonuclease [Chitinispirillaceae bacterium]